MICENNLHRYNVLKKGSKQKGNSLIKNLKGVVQFNDNMIIINHFSSLREASYLLNINYSNLSSIMSGKRKSKLILKYLNETTNMV
jgi:hypothetical protein